MVLYLNHMCQCWLHAVVWSHIGTLMHRLAAEPCSTAGLLFLSVSLWNDLDNPVFDGVVLAGCKSRANVIFICLSFYIPLQSSTLFSISLISVNRFVLWGWGPWTDRVYTTFSQPCTADLFFYNNNNNDLRMPTVKQT